MEVKVSKDGIGLFGLLCFVEGFLLRVIGNYLYEWSRSKIVDLPSFCATLAVAVMFACVIAYMAFELLGMKE